MARKLVGRKIYEVEQRFGESIEDILKRFNKDKTLTYRKQASLLGCNVKAQHINSWRKSMGMKGRKVISNFTKGQLVEKFNLKEGEK